MPPVASYCQQQLSYEFCEDPKITAVRRSSTKLSAESMFPLDIVHALLNGFFTYLYPLCPFPHEPSFRAAWAGREDALSGSYLALLASMLGAYIAAFPGQAREQIGRSCYLDEKTHLANDIKRCRRVCMITRAADRLEIDGWEVHTAATSYYLALIHLRTEEWRHGSIYLGECFTVLSNTLNGPNKDSADSRQPSPNLRALQQEELESTSQNPQSTFLSATGGFVRDEVGRRIFWTAFAETLAQWHLGMPIASHIIPPSTLAEPHPQLPRAVDDIYLLPDRVGTQPQEEPSIMKNFNTTVKLYKSYSVALFSSARWSSEGKHQCLGRKWYLWSRALKDNGDLGSSLETTTIMKQSTPSTSQGLDSSQGQTTAYSKGRQSIQHRIQLARLLSSHASLRSYILETLTGLETPKDLRRCAMKSLAEKGKSIYGLSCAKQVIIASLLDGLNSLGEDILEICANELVSRRLQAR